MMVYERMMIYRDEDGFTLKGMCSGTKLHACGSASGCIDRAVELIPETGGELFLEAGRYELARPIRLKDNMKLSAARGAVLSLAEDGTGPAAIVCSGLNRASVHDVEIQGDNAPDLEAGIILDDCGDCTVTDVRCRGVKGYGIWVRNNSFLCSVTNCSVSECTRANLFFENLRQGRYGDYLPNTASNCMLYGGDKGVLCERSICTSLIGCTVYQPRGVAFHVNNGSNSTLVSGCRTYLCGRNAVRIEHAHENNVTGCIFGRQGEACMVIEDSYWGVVSSNEMIFSGAYKRTGPQRNADEAGEPEEVRKDCDVMVMRDAHGFSVTGNVLFNWSTAPRSENGIREDEKCGHNVITANNLNYFKNKGVAGSGKGLVAGNLEYGETPYKT